MKTYVFINSTGITLTPNVNEIFKLAQNECVILVDELDRSFHTKLTIDFINKFDKKKFLIYISSAGS